MMERAGRLGIFVVLVALFVSACVRKDDGGGATRPALPTDWIELHKDFAVELVQDGLNTPVKMAFAPDGRLFFNELSTGNIRIIDAAGQLLAAPFATVNVISGGESGLIGIALSPSFGSDNYVYVLAAVAGPNRQQVIRFTAVGDAGTNPTVIVDNLPHGNFHNAGDIRFALDGTLFVTVGDTGNSSLAQTDNELAGRVLRYTADGNIPTDNPDPASPEWARGLRNSFDLTVHFSTGGLFATENGPTSDDELNYIAKGKNFEWPTLPPSVPGSQVGYRAIHWPTIIAPTGLTFHTGTGFGSGYANNLFVLSYTDAEIHRFGMSGAVFADVDFRESFGRLRNLGIANKPLDVVEAADGSLYLSTFSAIWRIYRWN